MAAIKEPENFDGVIDFPYNFEPRWYQLPVLKAFDQGYKNIDLVMPRRHGKDKVSVAILAKAMYERVGGYFYIFPEFNQGRKALWDNIDNDGFSTLEHIPKAFWANKNNQQMKLTLKNGSYLQIMGSADPDSLVGSNPVGIVYSEWSLQNPIVRGFMDPILKANNGWALYNYTPRGSNFAKKFHDDAKNDPKWFSFEINARDAGVFKKAELDEIKADYIKQYGDDGLFQQEYMIKFETPVQGAYYATQINQAFDEGRVGKFPYNRDLGVHTIWDLGQGDSTCIWFFQITGSGFINFIDYYENSGVALTHFAEVLAQKNYNYLTHYLPWDAGHTRQGKSESLNAREMLEDLGISGIKVLGKVGVQDGIQAVRKHFDRFRFDEANCERGITGLKEYKKIWSERTQMWSDMPDHNWASNVADAFRCIGQVLEDFKPKPAIKKRVFKSSYRPLGGYGL